MGGHEMRKLPVRVDPPNVGDTEVTPCGGYGHQLKLLLLVCVCVCGAGFGVSGGVPDTGVGARVGEAGEPVGLLAGFGAVAIHRLSSKEATKH